VSEPGPRFWEVFFEVYGRLPRPGPGNRGCAEKAVGLCRDLPPSPAVLDLGCGVGGQTLHLAELTDGSIVALDSHAPSIERLRGAVAERGLGKRVRPAVGDMAQPGMPPGRFDLIWSEGRSTTWASRTRCASATGCCGPVATSPSPTPSGARRIRPAR
jgi:SAM-dependent methyltransferase